MGPTTSGIGMDRTAGELNELIDALEELVQELAGRLAISKNTLAEGTYGAEPDAVIDGGSSYPSRMYTDSSIGLEQVKPAIGSYRAQCRPEEHRSPL